jgi:hypothetical protein
MLAMGNLDQSNHMQTNPPGQIEQQNTQKHRQIGQAW